MKTLLLIDAAPELRRLEVAVQRVRRLRLWHYFCPAAWRAAQDELVSAYRRASPLYEWGRISDQDRAALRQVLTETISIVESWPT